MQAPEQYTCQQLREATDGYAESRILGSGGFGVVYSGRVHDSPVAVKRIVLNDKRKAKMKSFSREIAAAAAVGRHPNLVEVVGIVRPGATAATTTMPPPATLACVAGAPATVPGPE